MSQSTTPFDILQHLTTPTSFEQFLTNYATEFVAKILKAFLSQHLPKDIADIVAKQIVKTTLKSVGRNARFILSTISEKFSRKADPIVELVSTHSSQKLITTYFKANPAKVDDMQDMEYIRDIEEAEELVYTGTGSITEMGESAYGGLGESFTELSDDTFFPSVAEPKASSLKGAVKDFPTGMFSRRLIRSTSNSSFISNESTTVDDKALCDPVDDFSESGPEQMVYIPVVDTSDEIMFTNKSIAVSDSSLYIQDNEGEAFIAPPLRRARPLSAWTFIDSPIAIEEETTAGKDIDIESAHVAPSLNDSDSIYLESMDRQIDNMGNVNDNNLPLTAKLHFTTTNIHTPPSPSPSPSSPALTPTTTPSTSRSSSIHTTDSHNDIDDLVPDTEILDLDYCDESNLCWTHTCINSRIEVLPLSCSLADAEGLEMKVLFKREKSVGVGKRLNSLSLGWKKKEKEKVEVSGQMVFGEGDLWNEWM